MLVFYNRNEIKLEGDMYIMSPEVAKDLIRRIEVAIAKVESNTDIWTEAIS